MDNSGRKELNIETFKVYEKLPEISWKKQVVHRD